MDNTEKSESTTVDTETTADVVEEKAAAADQTMETGGTSDLEKESLVYTSKTGELVGPEAYSKSVTEYLACRVCDVSMKNVRTAVMHYKGRGHNRNLKQIAEKLGEKNIPLLTESIMAEEFDKNPDYSGDSSVGITNEEALKEFGEVADHVYVDDEGQLWGPEKKAKNLGEFKNCLLCKVSTSSFKTASSHYNGMKHVRILSKVAQLKGLVITTMGKSNFTNISQTEPAEGSEDPLGIKADVEKSSKRKGDGAGGNAKKIKKEETYCELCNVTLSSDAHAQMHYDGKKHQKKSKEQYETKDPSTKERGDGSQKITMDLVGAGILFCPTCDVLCLSAEQLNSHYSGMKHRNNLEEEMQKLEQEKVVADGENGEYYRTVYKCGICNNTLNSKQQYVSHIESNKHKRKYAAQNEKKLENRLGKVKKNVPSTEGKKSFAPPRGRGGPNRRQNSWNKSWSQRQQGQRDRGWGIQSSNYSQPWRGGSSWSYQAAPRYDIYGGGNTNDWKGYGGNTNDWNYGEMAARDAPPLMGQGGIGRGRGFSGPRGNQTGPRGGNQAGSRGGNQAGSRGGNQAWPRGGGGRGNQRNNFQGQMGDMGGQGQAAAGNRGGSYGRDAGNRGGFVQGNGVGQQTGDTYQYGPDDQSFAAAPIVAAANNEDWGETSAVLSNLSHEAILSLAAQALKGLDNTKAEAPKPAADKPAVIEWANDPDYQTYVKGQANIGGAVSYQGRAAGDIRKQWTDTSGTSQSWGTGRMDYTK